MSADELAKTLPITRPAVVQHLGLLKRLDPPLAGDPHAQPRGEVIKI
jgi:hypothetical protein